MPKDRRSILATLLFTDIVGSSRVAEEMGDRRWRELLARHNRLLRAALKEFGGREMDTAGDGLFARFESPAAAIRCSSSATDKVRDLGIEIRAGIHIGETEVLDGKLSGLNVHAAARTMAEAGPGQILVTSSVRDLVRGAGFGFQDRGTRELKGIEGEWHLFEVTSVDDTPRPTPAPEEEAKSRRIAITPPPLATRRSVRIIAVGTVIALVAAGAALAIASRPHHAATGPITGCEVAPYPPLNDRAFNQAVFDGLTDASTTWGTSVRNKVSQGFDEGLWAKDIDAFVAARCSLIVTVGSSMADVTLVKAEANPTSRFLLTDAVGAAPLRNVASVVFHVEEAAFQAGYLAAGMTKTGKVGTFGGTPIPTVISFMNGFAAGVLHYNQVNGTNVKLLGWDPTQQTGTFVDMDKSNFGAFADVLAARKITADLISQRADIIMPVDGPAGEEGGGQAAKRASGVLLIGVDTDQHFSAPSYANLWLTSVMKIYRKMVFVAMGQIVHGDFKGGIVAGTLANGGVGLAPFYDLGDKVTATLQTKLDEIAKGIADGSISVDPASYLPA
jgi:basic membrane protein A